MHDRSKLVFLAVIFSIVSLGTSSILFSDFSVGFCNLLSVTNLSLDDNLLMFQLNAPVIIRASFIYAGSLMTTGTFSRNIGKLFSELKLVTDNFLFTSSIV